MIGWEELKKIYFQRWEGKIHPFHLPMHYEAGLMEVDKELLEIEEILRDGGMEGLGYQSQEEKIRIIGEGAGALNEYIGTLAGEVDRQIDQPLYKGFQNEATELLSRIKLENYETENTLGIHTRHKMTNEYGAPYTYDSVKKLTFADFLGITGIDKNKAGVLVGMPEEFQAFTNMFAMEYDRIKGELANPDGSPVDLESYLEMVHSYGEFDNKMDKPVLEFISGLLDAIFVKPLAEMCIGHDLITGEDLSDSERGMKGVFAVVDVVSMLVGIKASGAVKLFGKESLQLAGKTVLVGAMSYAAAYGAGKLGEELGLPWPVTLLLSLGAGVTVATVGSRYVFTDSTGKVLLEADVDEVDALRRLESSKAANAGGAKSPSALGDMPPEDGARYEGYWKWKEVEGTGVYKNGTGYDGWYRPDGTMNYPHNAGGIPGTEKMVTIGDSYVPEVGRYGVPGPKSDYVTQPGTEPGRLALPPTTDPSTYIKYKVVTPIPGVEEAIIMPWAGAPGLGIQYKLPKPIQWYIDNGHLIEK